VLTHLGPSVVDPGFWGGVDCTDGSARLEFDLFTATGSKGEAAALVDIWLMKDTGPIDYDSPPTTRGRSVPRVRLSGGDLCWPGGDFPFPPFGTRARIGVRLLNLAGSVSEPREAFLDGPPTPYQGEHLSRAPPKLALTPIPNTDPRYGGYLVMSLAVLLGLLPLVALVRTR
jgi:hypothetical protein